MAKISRLRPIETQFLVESSRVDRMADNLIRHGEITHATPFDLVQELRQMATKLKIMEGRLRSYNDKQRDRRGGPIRARG